MFQGKKKTLTFSYDDGVLQDKRLIKLFDKYGMKATFNLNSGLFTRQYSVVYKGKNMVRTVCNREDVKHIYEGHEVAAHTLTHPNLLKVPTEQEIIRQVEEDRVALSELCGYEVVGMAYPGGRGCYDDRTIELIRNHTGVQYARSTNSTYQFELPKEKLELNPSVHHIEMEKLFELGKQFLELETDTPQVFYVWGHSYEFDMHENWEQFEGFLEMMSGRKDICYCTNKECILL